jgi:hypothetical protein
MDTWLLIRFRSLPRPGACPCPVSAESGTGTGTGTGTLTGTLTGTKNKVLRRVPCRKPIFFSVSGCRPAAWGLASLICPERRELHGVVLNTSSPQGRGSRMRRTGQMHDSGGRAMGGGNSGFFEEAVALPGLARLGKRAGLDEVGVCTTIVFQGTALVV